MTVTEESNKKKVGAVLAECMGLTKKQISRAKFRAGGIRKNGVQCRVTEIVAVGDVIEVCLENDRVGSAHLVSPEMAQGVGMAGGAQDVGTQKCLQTSQIQNVSRNAGIMNVSQNVETSDVGQNAGVFHVSQNLPASDMLYYDGMPEILYEDEDLLVVNKPAGMVTHPSGRHYSDSLSNLVMDYCRRRGEVLRVRAIGRLDRETSGIVVFAKNQVAAARLQAQREAGGFFKEYLAVVHGELPVDGGSQSSVPGLFGRDSWTLSVGRSAGQFSHRSVDTSIYEEDADSSEPYTVFGSPRFCSTQWDTQKGCKLIPCTAFGSPRVCSASGSSIYIEETPHTINHPIAPDPENPLKMMVVPYDLSNETPRLQAVNPQTINPQTVNPKLTNPNPANPKSTNLKAANHQAANHQAANHQAANLKATQQIAARPAVTHYRTLYATPTWSLVLLRLETGRTHQIRVHMKSIGHPLLGDTLYAADLPVPPPFAFTRAALHARRIILRQPFTGEIIAVEAPLPEDFAPLRG